MAPQSHNPAPAIAEAKAYNTYIAPHAAAAAVLLCHRQRGRIAYRPAPTELQQNSPWSAV